MKRTRLEQLSYDIEADLEQIIDVLDLEEDDPARGYIKQVLEGQWMSGWYRGVYDERIKSERKTPPLPGGSNPAVHQS